MTEYQIDIIPSHVKITWEQQTPAPILISVPSPPPPPAPSPILISVPMNQPLTEKEVKNLQDKAFSNCCSTTNTDLANTYGMFWACGFFFFVFSIVYFIILK